jgi:hypothetical protein
MSEQWLGLGCPDVEIMLAEIAGFDMLAAALARAVWESIPPGERGQWCEQFAAAVASYRGPAHKSRIGLIATERLIRLGGG